MSKKLLRRNVTLLYWYEAISSALILIPIVVPFFQQNGLSQTQIFTLQSMFALAVVLFEVPSGYFADRFGRKISLVVGAMLMTLGFTMYSLAHGFWPILAAEMLLGFGLSFKSGADSALLYDSLLQLRQEGKFKKILGRQYAFSGLSEAAASVLGGLLALISLRTPVVAQVLLTASAIPLALALYEPKRTKPTEENPFKDVLRITKYTLSGHREIKWIVLFAAVLGTSTHTMVWLTQPYYQAANVSLAWFGILWALQMLFLALFSHRAEKFETKYGQSRALLYLVYLVTASYILTALFQVVWALPVLLGFVFVRAVQRPLIQDYLNSRVESDIRATVLSVAALAQRGVYLLIGPVIGLVMDKYSLPAALWFSAGIYGLSGLWVIDNMRKRNIM